MIVPFYDISCMYIRADRIINCIFVIQSRNFKFKNNTLIFNVNCIYLKRIYYKINEILSLVGMARYITFINTKLFPIKYKIKTSLNYL